VAQSLRKGARSGSRAGAGPPAPTRSGTSCPTRSGAAGRGNRIHSLSRSSPQRCGSSLGRPSCKVKGQELVAATLGAGLVREPRAGGRSTGRAACTRTLGDGTYHRVPVVPRIIPGRRAKAFTLGARGGLPVAGGGTGTSACPRGNRSVQDVRFGYNG